ncbi:MAG: hypothetical protein FWD60_10690 [Candidatus Azobacteroides sp.]|nr:hypothetical protein [Candidatus Azobacteroides sp.]
MNDRAEDKIIKLYHNLKSEGIIEEELTELLYYTLCVTATVLLKTKTPLSFYSIKTDEKTSGCIVLFSKADANERMQLFVQLIKGVEQSVEQYPGNIMAVEVTENLISVIVMKDCEYIGVKNSIKDSQCRHYFDKWCKHLQIEKTGIQLPKTTNSPVNMRYLKITTIDQSTGSILFAIDEDTNEKIDVRNTSFRVRSTLGLNENEFDEIFPMLIPKRMQTCSISDQQAGRAVRIKTCEFVHDQWMNGLDIAGDATSGTICKLSSPEFWYMDYPTAKKYGVEC